MNKSLKSDFPIFTKLTDKRFVYLDSAATAHKPLEVIKSVSDFYSFDYGTVHRSVYGLASKATSLVEESRQNIAKFINAKLAEEIVFTSGTSASLNMLARSFAKTFLSEGDVILVSEIEHHSNLLPWKNICVDTRATLKLIPVLDSGELDLEALETLLSNNKVKLISVCHVSNVLGVENNISEIAKLAHKYGAFICVDAAQSIAHEYIDVQNWDIDFLAFSAHKVYGPNGIGVLYGKKELLDQLPPDNFGGGMVKVVSLYEKEIYEDIPLKFEAGTPNISGIIGLGAAIKYLSNIGLKNIQQLDNTLMSSLMIKLLEIPNIKILGNPDKKTSLVSFVIEGVHCFDIATLLDCKGVAIRAGHHCSQNTMKRFGITGSCRVSFGIYNEEEDVELFISSLKSSLTVIK